MGRFDPTEPDRLSSKPQPPLALDYLSGAIKELQSDFEAAGLDWPGEIPEDTTKAAIWWMNRQKPRGRSDPPCKRVNVVGSEGGERWICPYHERVTQTLRIYVTLPIEHRRFIVKAAGDKMYWEGDKVMNADGSPGPFLNICDEIRKMRENPDDYINAARRKARAFFRGNR